MAGRVRAFAALRCLSVSMVKSKGKYVREHEVLCDAVAFPNCANHGKLPCSGGLSGWMVGAYIGQLWKPYVLLDVFWNTS
jgi:hypothetical protein